MELDDLKITVCFYFITKAVENLGNNQNSRSICLLRDDCQITILDIFQIDDRCLINNSYLTINFYFSLHRARMFFHILNVILQNIAHYYIVLPVLHQPVCTCCFMIAKRRQWWGRRGNEIEAGEGRGVQISRLQRTEQKIIRMQSLWTLGLGLQLLALLMQAIFCLLSDFLVGFRVAQR